MSSKKTQELKKLVRDLRRLVSDAKSSKRDRKLKGLLLHLKKEVLRNAEMADNFRQVDGVNVLCGALESHSTLKDSIVSLCLSLLANLTALDSDTKKNVAISRTCETAIQILEETQAADVVNCGCRLLGNIVHCIKPGDDFHIRISKIMVYQIGTTEDENCKQSLLRTACILSRIPLYTHELLKRSVICYLSKHLISKSLRLPLLQVFSILCESEPEASLQLTKADNFAELVSLMASADAKIAKTATLILLRISESAECRGDIGSAGGIEGLISLLRTNRAREFSIHSEVIKSLSLCCHDVLCRQKLKQTEGLSELISELHSEIYAFDDPTVTCILSSLFCYYFDDPSLLFMVKKLNLVKVLGFRLNQMVLALDKRQCRDKNIEDDVSLEGLNEEECIVFNPESQSVSDTRSGDNKPLPSSLDVATISEVDSVVVSSSLCSSPRLSDDLPTSSESSRCSTPCGDQEAAKQGQSVSLNKPGPSFHPHIPAGSPEWSGSVFPKQIYSFEEDDFAEEKCRNTSMFEGILETLATSPSSSRRPGVPHASTERFEHTPYNLIDSLLTAPSPYATSPPPSHPTPPVLNRESSTDEHPLLALIARLSFIPHCLPSLAQHCLLHPLMKFFSHTHGRHKQCYHTLNRIFKQRNCLSECVLCHCAPYIWTNICMLTRPDKLLSSSLFESSSTDEQEANATASDRNDSADPNLTPHTSTLAQSSCLSSTPDSKQPVTPSHRHRSSTCETHSLSLMATLVLSCNQSCSPSHFCCSRRVTCGSTTNSTELNLSSSYVQWPKGASEILENLANEAMSPFGAGLLAHLLQRGSTKEKMAAALSVPFLISDTKVLSKMMIGYEGFENLAEILSNQSQHRELVDFALEALCMLLQKSKIKKMVSSPEANARPSREAHSMSRSREGVVSEIAQTAASLHTKVVTKTPTFCFSPALDTCPYSDCAGSNIVIVDSTEPPPAKRSRLEPSCNCRYESALSAVPPDVSIAVDCEENELDSNLEPGSLAATFMAHKSVLSAESNVFEAMFSSSFRESTQLHVTFKNRSALAFKTLLHYMYGCRLACPFFKSAVLLQEETTTGSETVDQRHTIENSLESAVQQSSPALTGCGQDPVELPDVVSNISHCGTWNVMLHVELLVLSDQYFISSLRNDCENVLSRNITSDTAVDLFSVASVHRADFVKFRCIEYIFSIRSHRDRARVTRQLLTSDNIADALGVIRELTKI